MYEFTAKGSEVFLELWRDAIVARRRTFDLGERRERDEVRRCHARVKEMWVAKRAKQKHVRASPVMSNLPARPEFSRTASAWHDSGDERRPGTSPERPRDDRDRDVRDRDRGNRSRYPARSPPPRSTSTYTRDAYHAREYRGYDDRDDRRKDWDRDRDRDRDMDRDRHYRRQRVDDTWTPRKDYSPNRAPNRRAYHRERGRDDYRRERDWDRGRSWDRDDQRPRDREHDRRPPSPNYRPAPSPRRGEHTPVRVDTQLDDIMPDHHWEPHSPPRRAPPSYPSRGRRSASPRSVGSRRSSPLPRARRESYTRDMPRPRKSPSPRRASPSPNRRVSSPTRRRPSPETTGGQLHSDDLHTSPNGPDLVQGTDQAVESTAVMDDQVDVRGTNVSLTKGKDRSDNGDGELHVKAESPVPAGSPIECQEVLIPTVETAPMPSSDVTVTQPYLPTIPRYEAKPRFSVGYESEASTYQVGLIDSSWYHCL